MSLRTQNTLKLNVLTPTCVPVPCAPVLIRLKQPYNIFPQNGRAVTNDVKSSGASTGKSNEDKAVDKPRSLLAVAHRYGYAVAVMEYKYDGFDVAHPQCFHVLEPGDDKAPTPRKTIPLSEVDAWAYLNEQSQA